MAGVIGIQGYKSSTGVEKLIVVYANDFHIWRPSFDDWIGQSVSVSSDTNKWRSTVFLDRAIFANGYTIVSAGVVSANDDTKSYDGTKWTNEYATGRIPLSLYAKQVGDRIYYGNLYFKQLATNYSSMVWFSDLADNKNITYGFEEGTSISGTVGTNRLSTTDPAIYFKTRNIKVGDPIYITSLNKTLYISSIETEKSLFLTENLTANVTGSSFWAGSNWLQVSQNDGDAITGFGDNSDNVLIFKRDSVYRYDRTSLRKIKGVPGTTSQESVVNIKDKTYYFHPTGIWECDGQTSRLISRPIQDYIDGIAVDEYIKIVSWVTGSSQETLRVSVGTISDVNNDISVTNCILDYDTTTQTWSPGNLPFKVTCATEFRESNVKSVFLGTDDGKVYQDNKGTSDNGDPIPWMVDTGFHFPAGPGREIEFEKFLIYARKGRGMQVRYKLYGTPDKKDKQWRGLNDVEDDVTEIKLKSKTEISNIGRGIAIQFTESSISQSPVIERVDIYYKDVTQRNL
jgi:hypothetical protein